MSRLTAALLMAVAFALPMTHLNAAQVSGPPQVVVKVSPAEVVDIRLYTPAIDGTTIGTTNPQGTVMLDFLKIANAGKIGVKYTATTERCPDRDSLLLNSDDGVLPPAQPRCRRRGAGAFVLGYDAILNVKIGGPAISPTWLYVAGAGAGLTAVALTAEGEPATSTNPTPTPNPNPGGGNPTNPVDISALLGTYNINANKITDTGCNFLPSFTGRLVLSGPSDGSQLTARMIERLERAYAGAMTAAGAYNGTGTGNLDGFIYNGSIAGQVGTGGTSVTGTETMNFTAGCPGRQVVYQFTGNK